MKVLITYDLNIGHPEVKAAMEGEEFLDHWTDNNKVYYLPNTTLWHSDLIDTDAAKNILIKVVAKLNLARVKKIRIERVICVPASPWSGIEGDPHSK